MGKLKPLFTSLIEALTLYKLALLFVYKKESLEKGA